MRYGLLLAKAGCHAEAKTVLAEVLAQLKRAPKYVRRAQAEWVALAESALRDQARVRTTQFMLERNDRFGYLER